MLWPVIEEVSMKNDPFMSFIYYFAASTDTSLCKSAFVPMINFNA